MNIRVAEIFEKDGRGYHFENQDTWEAIVSYMDDEIREALHCEIAPCTNEVFMMRYLEKDPDFEKLLCSEFGITYWG